MRQQASEGGWSGVEKPLESRVTCWDLEGRQVSCMHGDTHAALCPEEGSCSMLEQGLGEAALGWWAELQTQGWGRRELSITDDAQLTDSGASAGWE